LVRSHGAADLIGGVLIPAFPDVIRLFSDPIAGPEVVKVLVATASESATISDVSTDGGASWSRTVTVAPPRGSAAAADQVVSTSSDHADRIRPATTR
jgi:hypothetical protein